MVREEVRAKEYAWYETNAWNAGMQYAQPVGTKLPNPWGLFDMHGNVYEWAQDWYANYPSTAQINPTGPVRGSPRVLRGGYFYFCARSRCSAHRYAGIPNGHGAHFGALLVRIQ